MLLLKQWLTPCCLLFRLIIVSIVVAHSILNDVVILDWYLLLLVHIRMAYLMRGVCDVDVGDELIEAWVPMVQVLLLIQTYNILSFVLVVKLLTWIMIVIRKITLNGT